MPSVTFLATSDDGTTGSAQFLNPAGGDTLRLFTDGEDLAGQIGDSSLYSQTNVTIAGQPCTSKLYVNSKLGLAFTPSFLVESATDEVHVSVDRGNHSQILVMPVKGIPSVVSSSDISITPACEPDHPACCNG
jgi:hypothetical protein